MLNQTQALGKAKSIAKSQNLRWEEPIFIEKENKATSILKRKKKYWRIYTNINAKSSMMRIVLDARTGELVDQRLMPRIKSS